MSEKDIDLDSGFVGVLCCWFTDEKKRKKEKKMKNTHVHTEIHTHREMYKVHWYADIYQMTV